MKKNAEQFVNINKIGGPKFLVVAEIRESFPKELLLLVETGGISNIITKSLCASISSSVR